MLLKRDLSDKLKTTPTIVRTESGIVLPIRCYIASGIEVRSCTYPGNEYECLTENILIKILT